MKLWRYTLMAALTMGAMSACTQTANTEPTPSTEDQIVMAVRGSDRLYTTEYVVQKIVTYDDIVRLRGTVFSQKFDYKLPQGDRKVLIPMEARIKAYIDFSAFGPENVVMGPDSTITVILPDPLIVITSTKIDHGGIKTYVDMGRKKFTNAELSEYEQQGRAAIAAAIPSLGIESTARTDAYHLLTPLISKMGYPLEKIKIDFRKDFTDHDYINTLITNPRD